MGAPLKRFGPGVFKARVVGTGHGMAAHIGKAVLLRQREQGLADHPLGAAEVDDQGERGQIRGPLPQILHGGLGRDGQQQQVAGFDGFGIQQAVDGPAHPGEVQHDPVPVVAEDGPARLGVGLGHGAADEAQAHNADGAHQRRLPDGPGLPGHLGELLRRQGLSAVAPGVGRVVVDLDHQAVGPGGGRRVGHGRHQLGLAGGVAGIHHHGADGSAA